MLERNKAREWGRLGEMRGGGRRFQERGGEGRQRGKVGAATVGWKDLGPSSVRRDDGRD
jgi:hypothetical protein